MTSSKDNPMTLTFRCPAELEGVLPPPVPAAQGLPAWLKAMPSQAFNAINGRDENTVKRCPPFVDAMTSGFLLPLICDLRVENGEFTWDNEIPPGGSVSFSRSPVGFHDGSQVIGSPLFEDDRFLIKFHNLWTIEAPEGYALLFTHPANRFDLPFTTLTGLVDCDRYHDNWIHFPAHWHDANFSGVLPKGTPVAQCIPVKRETWVARTLPFTAEETSARTISQRRSTVSQASTGASSAPEPLTAQEFRGGARPQEETAARRNRQRHDGTAEQLRAFARRQPDARFAGVALPHFQQTPSQLRPRDGIARPQRHDAPKSFRRRRIVAIQQHDLSEPAQTDRAGPAPP